MGLFDAVTNIVGKVVDTVTGNKAAEENWDKQKKAMKNSIQWKVDDARAAGVSPLFALGAPTFSPAVNFGGTSFGDGSIGSSVADIAKHGIEQFGKPTQMDALALVNAGLQNDLLKAQIAKLSKEVLAAPPGPVIAPPMISQGPNMSGKTAQDWSGRYGQVIGEVAGWIQGLGDTLEQTGLNKVWNDMGVSSKSMVLSPRPKRPLYRYR